MRKLPLLILVIMLLLYFDWSTAKNKEGVWFCCFDILYVFLFLICTGCWKIQIGPPPNIEGDTSYITKAHYLHYRRLTHVLTSILIIMISGLFLIHIILELILHKSNIHVLLPLIGYFLIFCVILYSLIWAVFYLVYGIKRLIGQKI